MGKNRVLYITDYCLTPYEKISRAGILCEGEKILGIGGASAFTREPGLEVIEMPDSYAVPGFIDCHIHGAGGFDSSAAFEEGSDIEAMCKVLASHGVTSFLPTMVAAPRKNMLMNVSALASMIEDEHHGAEPSGIHVEGPFFNKLKHGSQQIENIMDIDLGFAKELIAEGKGRIKIMSFAPELEDSDKLIELLLENGVIPSMGHSMATQEDVLRAIDAGATRCTHIYNGMPQLHQREISLTSVALTDDRVSVEIIADGAHIHPRIVDLTCRAKPKHLIIGISDAVQGAGLNDGRYHVGTSEVEVKDGIVRTTGEGVLAGTTMTLERGWHQLVTYSHMPITDAAACFTSNPARDIGLITRGELKPGKRADISFFDCTTNKATMTVSKGRIVYEAEQRPTLA